MKMRLVLIRGERQATYQDRQVSYLRPAAGERPTYVDMVDIQPLTVARRNWHR